MKDKWGSLPKFLDYKALKIETWLSGRMLSSVVTQVRGMLDSAVEMHRRRLFMEEKLWLEGKRPSKALQEAIRKVPRKPNCSKINPEISSKNCGFEDQPCDDCCQFIPDNDDKSAFDGYLHLYFLGKEADDIYLPIKFTKVSNKYRKMGAELKGSFLLKADGVNFRWEKKIEEKKGKTKIGADPGKNTVLTLSDGQATPMQCNHGHSMNSICGKIARKRKGSKAFKEACAHRENFVNWSINQLNFRGMDILAYEDIYDMKRGKACSREMSHWSYPLIREKAHGVCEETGVRWKPQSCAYRSQRCHVCGLVLRSNRSGKVYSCENCGYVGDSDLNAAKNHEADLPEIPGWILGSKLNRAGFWWMEDGFYEYRGEERGVPLCRNEVTVVDH